MAISLRRQRRAQAGEERRAVFRRGVVQSRGGGADAGQEGDGILDGIVALADAMTERGVVDWSDGGTLTPHGRAWLDEKGIAVEARRGRPVVRPCLDVT